MALSDEQITQIRERLKELANHAREHAFCDGYRDTRPISMRRLDDEKFFRDLLALVDQLCSERDDRHFVCEAHVPTGSEADKTCPCCEAVHRDDLRIEAEAAVSRLRTALEAVVDTFKRDEAQGYRSRDRQFAIEILEAALRLPQETTGQEEKAESSQR